jgi:hypothetical protein
LIVAPRARSILQQVTAIGAAVPAQASGNYPELGVRPANSLRSAYPLPITPEAVTIANPGFRQYHYRVTLDRREMHLAR